MSLNAQRFRKKFARVGKDVRLKSITRTPPKLLRTDELISVFHTPSAERSLKICQRLQRMKHRSKKHTCEPITCKKRSLKGRNYHHLTPKNRRGEPYYGNSLQNMCLIKLKRHVAWHDVFGLQTLEETIAMLMLCVKAGRQVYIIFQYSVSLRYLPPTTKFTHSEKRQRKRQLSFVA